MKNPTFELAATAALAFAFAIASLSCSGGSDSPSGTDVTVTISPGSLTLATLDSTETLTAAVKPDSTPDKEVTWTSSDSSVADVVRISDTQATVTAKQFGRAEITATAKTGGKNSKCSVTVGAPVAGVALPKTASVPAGNSVQLAATITPPNAWNQNVTWQSGSPQFATVPAGFTGTTVTVTGEVPGTSRITVTADGAKTDYCDVTVTPAILPTGVTLNSTNLRLAPTSQGTIRATIMPTNATSRALTWTSSNEAVATVTPPTGATVTIRGVGAGSATITVKTANGVSSACVVHVAAPQGPGAFVAGNFGLLKNGAFAIDGTRLRSVYVDDQNNVHSTGRDSNNQAIYVWNGASIILPRDSWATAAEGQHIQVAADGRVHIAGYQASGARRQAKLWVDGVDTPLAGASGYNFSDATTVCVGSALGQNYLLVGGVVGAAADDIQGALWYNGDLISAVDAWGGYVRSVAVVVAGLGGNLYVAGDFGMISFDLLAVSGGNYTSTTINDISGNPYGPIDACTNVGTSLYAVGYDGADAIYYGSNRSKTVLPKSPSRLNARAVGLSVQGNNVYVAGFGWNSATDSVAMLWTNNALQELEAPKKYNYAEAYSVFVKPN